MWRDALTSDAPRRSDFRRGRFWAFSAALAAVLGGLWAVTVFGEGPMPFWAIVALLAVLLLTEPARRRLDPAYFAGRPPRVVPFATRLGVAAVLVCVSFVLFALLVLALVLLP